MRLTVLVFAILAANPAFAAQDRYGPPRADAAGAAHAARLPAGALLDWTGKTPALPIAPQGAAARGPEPIAPWAQRLAPPPPQAAPLSAPAPQRQARALPPPADAPRPYAARVAAPPPVPTAQAAGASERPRFYSVARQYGAEPDPIPMAAPPRGQALTLTEIPATENLGRTQAPLDDGRAAQAVPIPDTRQNAASNRVSRLGL